MISPKIFFEVLKKEGIEFFTGVPDSLLKGFCQYVEEKSSDENHIIAANEGCSIGIATGYHLETGQIPLVYLQNSGLGNTVNPLLSLTDKEVYSIPLILLIGWRGEPGIKDEPQHIKQGRVTKRLLEALEIPFKVISSFEKKSIENTKWAINFAKKSSSPVALLVKKGSFEKYELKKKIKDNFSISREEVISLIIKHSLIQTTFVSTTGMISRELYEQRDIHNQNKSNDFLTVGSMGHASQIALGIASSNPYRKIICLDGDGSLLMHLGGITNIGTRKDIDFFHIVINNGAHDSVGGQPTVAQKISLTSIAKACLYDKVLGPITNKDEIIKAIKELCRINGKRFLEINVKKGARSNLGRPRETPLQNKFRFMNQLSKNQSVAKK